MTPDTYSRSSIRVIFKLGVNLVITLIYMYWQILS